MSIEIRDLVPESEFNTIPLSHAVAIRFWYEFFQNQADSQETPALPLLQGRTLLSAKLFEQLFSSPSQKLKSEIYEKLFVSAFSEAIEDGLDKRQPNNEPSFDRDKLSQAMTQALVQLFKPLFQDSLEETIRTKEKAEVLAETLGVSPGCVYLQEELYKELVRSGNSAKEMAETTARFPKIINVQTFTNAFNEVYKSSNQTSDELKYMPELDNLFTRIVLESETTRAAIAKTVIEFYEITGRVYASKIIRFWGEEELEEVAPIIEQNLNISLHRTPILP